MIAFLSFKHELSSSRLFEPCLFYGAPHVHRVAVGSLGTSVACSVCCTAQVGEDGSKGCARSHQTDTRSTRASPRNRSPIRDNTRPVKMKMTEHHSTHTFSISHFTPRPLPLGRPLPLAPRPMPPGPRLPLRARPSPRPPAAGSRL
jgi:hypothetical protein